MPSLLGCCCQPNGGCNGWWSDDDPQVPSTGFETGDTKTLEGEPRCTRPDGTDCGVEDDPTNCCGPAVPGTISVTATTWWDFMWSRHRFGFPCQGGLGPVDPPEPIPHCGQQTWTVWEGGEGWTWVEGGGLNVTLVHDNEAAAAAGDYSSGEMPPSCCSHYYYGSASLGGPSRPAFSTNPWGYESYSFTCGDGLPPGAQIQYQPPGSLRAYCRMVLTFKGEGPNGQGVQPRIFLQAKLELYVGLEGFTSGSTGADHWIDGIANGNLPEAYRTRVALLFGSASVDVHACNCTGIGEVGDDVGVNVMDKIDWGLQPTAARWNYAWPHPTASDDSDTSVWGTGSLFGACDPCTAETFRLHAYSCCTDANPITCPTGLPPSNCVPQHPWCETISNINNDSKRRHGLHVWSTADKAWADGYRKWYEGNEFGSNDETSWHCWNYATANPCQDIRDCNLNSLHSIASESIKGGFVSAAPIFFPRPGLRDFMVGVGDGAPV